MAANASYEAIIKRITESQTMTPETKEILNLLISFFEVLTKERDAKILQSEQRIEEVKAQVGLQLDQLSATWADKLDSSMTSLRNELSSAFSDRDAKLIEASKELSDAKHEILLLQAKNRKLFNSADDQDAYVRRNSIIFSGEKIPVYNENEDCTSIVRKLIRDDLGLNLDPLISTAHRLGKPPASDTSPDKRDIIVRFCQRDTKFKVYSSGRQQKIRGLYVNESLTPTRRSIHFALRKIREKHSTLVTGISTHNGRIFVYTKAAPNAPPESASLKTELNTIEALSSFCDNFIKEPLPNFLPASGRHTAL